jgi:PEP-CTERM motif
MKRVSAIAFIGFVAAVSMSRGDIIPSFAGTSPGSGTNTVWNYVIDITSNQQVTAGDFFTIYDFGPFISGSNAQPSGWTFSSALTTTPPAGTNPPDNGTLANLTWTYMGSTTLPTGTHLGNFSVTQSTAFFSEAPLTRTGYFAATATRNDGSNTKINNVGQVPVPVPVPEPTTLSLLALGAAGFVTRAIRRRR